MATKRSPVKEAARAEAEKRKREGEAIMKQYNEFYANEKAELDPGLRRAQLRALLKSTEGDEW